MRWSDVVWRERSSTHSDDLPPNTHFRCPWLPVDMWICASFSVFKIVQLFLLQASGRWAHINVHCVCQIGLGLVPFTHLPTHLNEPLQVWMVANLDGMLHNRVSNAMHTNQGRARMQERNTTLQQDRGQIQTSHVCSADGCRRWQTGLNRWCFAVRHFCCWLSISNDTCLLIRKLYLVSELAWVALV